MSNVPEANPDRKSKARPALPKLTGEEWRAAVPPGLRVLPRWVGSYRKVPVHPRTGALARVDDASTWGTFSEVGAWVDARVSVMPRPYCPGFIMRKGDGLVGLDFDSALDDDGKLLPWAEALVRPFLATTYVERSPGGRGLRLFAIATLPITGKRSGARMQVGGGAVEVYDDRRFLTVTGIPYEGATKLGPAQVELDRLFDAIGMRARLTAPDAAGPMDVPTGIALVRETERVRGALAAIPPDISYPDWLTVLMALHSGLGPETGLMLAEEWSKGGDKYVPGEVAEKFKGFGQRSGVTLGSLYWMAEENGWPPPARDPGDDFRDLPESAPSIGGPAPTIPPPDDDLDALLGGIPAQEIPYHVVLLGRGKTASEFYVKGPDNISLFFTRDARWAGRFRWNLRRGAELDGAPVTDSIVTRLLGIVSRQFGWEAPPALDHMYRAIEVAARKIEYDPIREKILATTWDGVVRMDDWLVRAGCEDTAATRLIGRRWLIGSAGRALYEPQPGQPPLPPGQGTKFDTMLVLEGAQGVKKSWLLSAICPLQDYFFDSTFDFRNLSTVKDLYQHMQGNFILEAAELDALSRATEVSTVKAVIASRRDEFRAPYGRIPERFPRRSVLVGSVNGSEWLRDTTGNRRFWPVPVGKLDVEWVRENRDQLWAEAVVAYRAGESYWNDETLDYYLADLHKERMSLPVWADDVSAWMDEWQFRVFRVKDVLAGCPRIPASNASQLSSVLVYLGATRLRLRTEGRYESPKRWFATPRAKDAKSSEYTDDARKVVRLNEFSSADKENDKTA